VPAFKDPSDPSDSALSRRVIESAVMRALLPHGFKIRKAA